MHRFPAVMETMVDRAGGQAGSSTDAILVKMQRTTYMNNIETCLVPLLPQELKRIILGRNSCIVAKLRQYFLLYTERVALSHPGDQICSNLVEINKYLQCHALYTSRAKGKAPDTSVVYYLFHAEVPQILLEMLHQACYDSDYFREPKSYCIPYQAIEMLTCFIHPSSATFIHLPNKLFVDSSSRLESLADIVCGRALNWFIRFSASHFFGTASFTPQGKYWLFTHLDTYKELCSNMAKCGPFIKAQIKHGDVYSNDKAIITQLKMFCADGTPKYSARTFAHLVIGQCIYTFVNVLQYSHSDYCKFYKVSNAVRSANVLGNFHVVIKQVMSWTDPTHYLLPYLNGVSLCLEMEGGFEELLINDLKDCLKNDIPVGIQSLEYWTHERGKRTFPCRLAWFLVHVFCLDNRLGSGWCIHIICWYLERAVDEVAFKLIKCCGAELMDLAHLVDWDYPTQTKVQRVILEALLRFGGISHQDFIGDIHDDTVKDLPELKDYCIEAAVFSKKALCEDKMSIVVKQKRVGDSDRLKEEGNTHFKSARYKEAIVSYTEAIAVCPLSARTKQAIYYSNRAECYLQASEYKKAIHDCNRSLCLDKSLQMKVQRRRARAYQKLDLDYAAWLDMKCMREVLKVNKEEAGKEFEEAFFLLEKKLNIIKVDIQLELFRNFWFTWMLPEQY